MLITYLKIALRNMLRYKSFSLINIVGLSIGLTAFIAISLYVVDEFSYDQFHEKKDRIYRGVITASFDGETSKWGGLPNLVATTAMKEIPEVEKASRYFHHNFGDIAFISVGTQNFTEKALFFADPELLDIVTIPIIKGAKKNQLLSKPGTVIISESIARKYFDQQDPIGQTFTVDDEITLEVTGVYQDMPSNSFLQAELIASFSSNWFGKDRNQTWGNASFDTFFLLHPGVSQKAADEKISEMLERNIAEDRRWYTIELQPITDIRLHSGDMKGSDDREYGDYMQVKILIALACIILLIAAVNYMNLTTAQSQRRNKEVGITKTLGATFFQLTRRFYLEASLFVLIAMLISLSAFGFLLPAFNELSGKNISMSFAQSGWFWLGFGTVWVVLTFLAGIYPALYLSSFSPKTVLQKSNASGGQLLVRKSLVVFQFAISIVLIICSVVFYQQMNFIRNKNLGYQPEQVIAVMTTAVKAEATQTIKTAYESLSDVVSVARSQSYPGLGASGRSISKPGSTSSGANFQTVRATHEILNTLGIKLLAGKSLPENKNPKDTVTQIIINKATADYLGAKPEDIVNTTVEVQGFDALCEIVGVTEDFHFSSLHQQIGPMCFHNNRSEGYNYLLVKVKTSNLVGLLQQLNSIYSDNVAASFEYTFLDQQMDNLYKREYNMSQVVLLFAGLAILVACLGLYALTAFTAEQRTKEIGIRKVMGASVANLVGLLSKDFMMLVLLAFVIGIPAGYYVMTKWLEGFAYKTDITFMVFAISGVIALLIAGVTVSFESLRAARENPTKNLRSE
ncbi:MAG: ABC transporter permease [Cytophagia bacterium]|nr:ABC transporter permease [Cytophagia bacterium]